MERALVLWKNDTSWEIARVTASGDLVITGEDTEFLGEEGRNYEYSITVNEADVASLVAALGGNVDTDPLDLLKRNPESASRAWLEAHGVPVHFWCY